MARGITHKRKSQHAKDLINFSKWVAEQFGMPLLMGILSNDRTEAKIRLYQRHIHHCGALFIHNLPLNKGVA